MSGCLQKDWDWEIESKKSFYFYLKMELCFVMFWFLVQIPEIAVKTLEPSFDVPVVNVSWSDPREKTLTLSDRRVIADDRISIERPFTHDWNLYIRNVVPSDAGKYMCTINTNPVKIKYIISGIKAREGETVQLICNATGVPIPTVTWYRRSSGSKTELKEVVGSNGEVLLIHNISRYCDDLYECVAFNDIPPAASREMRVRGKETILECRVSSNPKVYSAWKRNGYEIDNNTGKKDMRRKYRVELYEDDKYTITLSLRIMSIEAEDYGAYTCVSRNELGSDSEDMILYEYIEHTPPPPISRPPVTYKTETRTWAPETDP
ncbi:hypothetical protein KUTeg_017645 [Tegillarca granosa]|uniref:Ig-like domain-containing protein n=1 Tax=Tegillarca granosa TaxID=220873 RepID=A0ABQ9EKE3_TEGGR|nr:hypothetical protein KUTeg_017645 [Tegillarca granosa]